MIAKTSQLVIVVVRMIHACSRIEVLVPHQVLPVLTPFMSIPEMVVLATEMRLMEGPKAYPDSHARIVDALRSLKGTRIPGARRKR